MSSVPVAQEALQTPATGFDVLALDPQYGGSCPCATVVIDGARLELHCWRTCFRCEYVGIHYEGPEGRAAAERVKPLLDAMDWYGEWPIVEGFRYRTGDAAMTDDQVQTPKPGEPEPAPPVEETEPALEDADTTTTTEPEETP